VTLILLEAAFAHSLEHDSWYVAAREARRAWDLAIKDLQV
jgi:hypothetical protein